MLKIYRVLFVLMMCGLFSMPVFSDEQYKQQIDVTRPASSPTAGEGEQTRCAVLLHGLIRRSSAMEKIAEHLAANNYVVVNINYPSRYFPIEVLAANVIPAGIQACKANGIDAVNIVTHSLGGILVRSYTQNNDASAIERVVMLGPPNKGSEVVDELGGLPGFVWLNGPAGLQLGTDANSVPLSLGPVKFDTAVIAGTATVNLVLSTYLPDPDDGKVSVASTRVEDMCAHLQMDVSHAFMMKNESVIEEVLNYLNDGRFASADAQYPECSYR